MIKTIGILFFIACGDENDNAQTKLLKSLFIAKSYYQTANNSSTQVTFTTEGVVEIEVIEVSTYSIFEISDFKFFRYSLLY